MTDHNLKLRINTLLPGMAMIEGGDQFDGMLLGMHARRIVACVNACQGLHTAALETAGEQPVLALINAAIDTNEYDRQADAGEGVLFEAVRSLDEIPS